MQFKNFKINGTKVPHYEVNGTKVPHYEVNGTKVPRYIYTFCVSSFYTVFLFVLFCSTAFCTDKETCPLFSLTIEGKPPLDFVFKTFGKDKFLESNRTKINFEFLNVLNFGFAERHINSEGSSIAVDITGRESHYGLDIPMPKGRKEFINITLKKTEVFMQPFGKFGSRFGDVRTKSFEIQTGKTKFWKDKSLFFTYGALNGEPIISNPNRIESDFYEIGLEIPRSKKLNLVFSIAQEKTNVEIEYADGTRKIYSFPKNNNVSIKTNYKLSPVVKIIGEFGYQFDGIPTFNGEFSDVGKISAIPFQFFKNDAFNQDYFDAWQKYYNKPFPYFNLIFQFSFHIHRTR